MDGRHDFILSTVAERLSMKLDDVEEFMLDDNQVSLNPGSAPHTRYAHFVSTG